MRCPRIQSCKLFEQIALRCTLRIWQTYYCERAFDRCQRYRLIAAGELPEASLLPNGHSLPGQVPLEPGGPGEPRAVARDPG